MFNHRTFPSAPRLKINEINAMLEGPKSDETRLLSAHRQAQIFSIDIGEHSIACRWSQFTSLVVKVLAKTLFSPFFCVFIPLTFLSQVKSTSHPVFVWSCVWTATVCTISELPSTLWW